MTKTAEAALAAPQEFDVAHLKGCPQERMEGYDVVRLVGTGEQRREEEARVVRCIDCGAHEIKER